MVELVVIATLVILGFVFGQISEKRHYREIEEREKNLHHIPVVSGEWKEHIDPDDEGVAVSAGTVVASDYFKSFVSNLRNIFGGRLNAYETLLDRGRREAILRVKEKAVRLGAHKIVNLRVETSTVNSAGARRGSMPCVELFAYGTALYKKKPATDEVRS
ncbi:MAG: heavy metal-binding domain-containing protein [Bdellovibrionaceae bacterium]|nr:heavy metal-binding domain-containing protein [Bdellovibrionales bacterium]MCB9085150.1 heavy metal-binding domain-containing protein [Pseudobdellovibrionaceae bacterium]